MLREDYSCQDSRVTSFGISHVSRRVDGRSKIEALQWSMSQQLLKLGISVIIEWGTWGRSERDALRERAPNLGVAVELHFLDAPVEELFRRAQQRAMEDPPMTREDFQRSPLVRN